MSEKTLIIDAHIHLYPQADLNQAIAFSLSNMDSARPEKETAKIWLLTERADCSAFTQLQESVRVGIYHIIPTREQEALRVQLGERIVLYIIAGRQVVSADGLEIGTLASRLRLPDRELETSALIDQALEAGALVTINWAPGKWSGRRKTIVQSLLAQPPRPGLFIGDSAMRPTFWSEPDLMRKAVSEGWRILAGSDPLPFQGEERSFGRYGCMITGEMDPDEPVLTLKRLLAEQQLEPAIWGKRRGTWEFARRQFAIMREKKRRER
ncbi:MAG TPA: hypothetical protein PKI81_04090 [bacterium]|nr:hypothetical protein [bacterium]HOC87951.1 hypothetical protein [bacterium]